MAEGGYAMEEKGVRDRKREPEEYNFDYEKLADAEVDSEQTRQRDDAVWETTCDTEDPYTVEPEDFTENEDYGEYPEGDDLDDFDEGDGIDFRFRPWMIPAFAGMMVLAVLICIPLWKLSHHNADAGNDGVDKTAVVTTEAQRSEQASAEIPETGTIPEETAAVAEPESTPASETVTPEPAAVVTETPAATELPDTGNADALAEGNSMTFGDVNETVTAKDVSNLRSTPYTGDEGNVVGQLKNGETLVRTGRNDSTGWSRLEYNGQTVYAVSAYLTTDLTYKTPEKPTYPNRVSTQDGRVIVFTDCDDYIIPKELINLRTEPSTSEGDSTVRTQVRNGTNLHRTGYSETSGWSRVEYNGEILYAVTNYVVSGSAPE